MEIVLQWLDDLDDALFALVLVWERLRRSCLAAGTGCAAVLAGCAGFAADWALPLAAAAGASVLLAIGGAALAALAESLSGRRRAGS